MNCRICRQRRGSFYWSGTQWRSWHCEAIAESGERFNCCSVCSSTYWLNFRHFEINHLTSPANMPEHIDTLQSIIHPDFWTLFHSRCLEYGRMPIHRAQFKKIADFFKMYSMSETMTGLKFLSKCGALKCRGNERPHYQCPLTGTFYFDQIGRAHV